MNTPRGIRAVRALAASTVATFVALAGHVLGGGQLPSLIGIIVPAVVSLFISLAVIGRTLRVWRIAAVVLISQSMFHWLFVLGSPGSASSDSMGAMHHTLSDSITISAQTLVAPAMTIGHVLAAGVTIVALVRGEQAVRGLRELARSALARLIWPTPTILPVVAERRSHTPAPLVAPQHCADVHRTRGPPCSA